MPHFRRWEKIEKLERQAGAEREVVRGHLRVGRGHFGAGWIRPGKGWD